MARVGSWALVGDDDPQRAKDRAAERAESARTVELARMVNRRTERTAEKVRRMTELYRERLEGNRER